MANETKVDDWTGEADPDALPPHEERAMIDAALAAVEQRGTVAHADATRRIAELRVRSRPG